MAQDSIPSRSNDAILSTIVVADDQPDIRALLRRGLETEGYLVAEASSAAEIDTWLERANVDLITLDLRIGGEHGIAVTRAIRARSDVPILMITDAIADADRIACLEHGADDHVTKPFLIREVRARIRNVLRRSRQAPNGTGAPMDAAASNRRRFEFEGLVLDATLLELRSADGELLALTAAELNLLAVFAQQPAVVISRDELALAVKGRAWSPYDRTIDVLVARLRKRTGLPRLIRSVRGIGYVFTGKVRSL